MKVTDGTALYDVGVGRFEPVDRLNDRVFGAEVTPSTPSHFERLPDPLKWRPVFLQNRVEGDLCMHVRTLQREWTFFVM